jgi:hypothetical protein
MCDGRRRAGRHRHPPSVDSLATAVTDLSAAQLAVAGGVLIAVAGYAVFIVAPAWSSYSRVWERIAASFLTLFMLATLVGIGAAIGLAIVWSYDTFA